MFIIAYYYQFVYINIMHLPTYQLYRLSSKFIKSYMDELARSIRLNDLLRKPKVILARMQMISRLCPSLVYTYGLEVLQQSSL